MKRNKLSIITFCSVLTAGLFSCQTDKLDLNPILQVGAGDVFTTPTRVDQQVNSLYDAVKEGDFMGSRYAVYSDIRGEEFINRLTNGVTGLQTWNHTLVESTNEVNNLWRSAYQAINQCNIFLKGLDDNSTAGLFVPPAFPADFATTTADAYRGEARLLRAISYFYLLQLYAKPYIVNNGASPGVPLRLQAETTFDNNSMARATVAEVYAQIITDLDFAEQKLPATQADAVLPTRAHKNTAIAFKTRVYLAMQKWSNVVTEADKIVTPAAPFTATSGVKHALAPSQAAVFASPYNNLESILSFPFSTLDAPGTQNQLGYYYLPGSKGSANQNTGNGEYYLSRTGIAADSVTMPKADKRRGFISLAAGQYYLSKFSSASPYTDSQPAIRYAEVLLNLAEALSHTNGVDARAVALLNAVRTRSIADPYDAAEFADGAALATAILKERRAEFLGEGLRSFDCMRLNAQIPGKGTVPAVNPTDPNYIWPMPSSELFTNPALERN